MKMKVIACKVMLRELYTLAAQSPHTVDILWMQQKKHEDPPSMKVWLQKTIDTIEREEEPYDAICLAYGLCSNGTAGLTTTKTPLIIPRAHDCIALLLGSRKTYQQLFEENNGAIYWYSGGWLEGSDMMPSKARTERLYKQYEEKYGEDNAQYLMEMEQGWMKEYNAAFFIEWPSLPNEEAASFTKEAADYLNWEYRTVKGDDILLRKLIFGQWNEEDFLTVPAGKRIVATHDEKVLGVGV